MCFLDWIYRMNRISQNAWSQCLSIQSQKLFCVVIADVADHWADQIVVIGDFTVFHVFSDEVAKDASEVFVSRIRHERTGIGDHTHESG